MGETAGNGWGPILALATLILASLILGVLAKRAMDKGAFLSGFFLGNRGLGPWAMALTATVQSGGTFIGFPSIVYSHGWIVALWIASYLVVPIMAFGVLGKALARISRRTGAITVPDLFRERFGDPRLGLVASLLILFYLTFTMVAQFKAGAIILQVAWPGSMDLAVSEEAAPTIDWLYYTGLIIFTLSVFGYTFIGGFLAAVWTDLLQSILMVVGVMILLPLSIWAAGGLELATRTAVVHTGPGFVFGPGYERDFLPFALAVSFFVYWAIGNISMPAGMVRVMASRDTTTLRRSIVLLSTYNLFIYLPLIIICICARAVLPDLEKPDEVIPRMAMWTTRDWPGGSLLAGLVLAAPFGAVMASVSAFVLVITSGLVRDVYQRFLNPAATDNELRRIAHLGLVGVMLIGVLANLNPPRYLQALVVFSGAGMAGSLSVPALMTAYWRRATSAGMLAAMGIGALVPLLLYATGWILTLAGHPARIGERTDFAPYYLFGFHPLVWGVAASALAGILVSLRTQPPPVALLDRLLPREINRA